ncbi:MAG: HPP family protein [Candidatus Omnitrophica bacterium]|nr:HPP family protein [Candidatus Omnitrophota bacterium]MBD3269048.1 HPP family protein [Candidatus Omnitrophota bacterium]
MRKALYNINDKFKTLWKNYLLQSFLASLAIFIVLLFLSLKHTVIVVSIGATAFIIFAMPESLTARPRNVIGGYIIGIITGVIFSFLPHNSFLFSTIVYSLAVGFSIFFMVATDTEHPPASGIALGLTVEALAWEVVLITFVSAVVLSCTKYCFRRYLKNLV